MESGNGEGQFSHWDSFLFISSQYLIKGLIVTFIFGSQFLTDYPDTYQLSSAELLRRTIAYLYAKEWSGILSHPINKKNF